MKKITLAMVIIMASVAILGSCKGEGGNSGGVIGGVISTSADGATDFDFSKKDGALTSYIKKHEMFSSTWGFVGGTTGSIRRTSINQLSALTDVKSESMRFDLFMGYTGLGYEIGRNGADGTTDAEYLRAMEVIDALIANNVLPSPIYFANPEYSQKNVSSNGWKTVPDLVKWKEICKNIAAYMKSKGVTYGLHEIWNEPDFNAFFEGSWQDYIDMYIAGAQGILEANPDAMVAGVSAAFINTAANDTVNGKTKLESFIEQSAAAGLIPDAISWHYYGRGTKLDGIETTTTDPHAFNFSEYRNAALNGIQSLQDGTSANTDTAYDLQTVQQHLNEFNIYGPATDPVYKTAKMVPAMFNTMEMLLTANDITRITWAALLAEWQNDLSYDMIDTITLQRYPAYHAMWMYGRLPVDRIIQPALGGGLKTMAAADANRAGIIVYNDTDSTKNAKISFSGIPFEKGDVTVYIVDDNHQTYKTANEPYILETYKNVDVNGLAANLKLGKNCAYYIEVNNTSGSSDTEVLNPLSKNYVRKDYYYPSRGDNTPYSDIHLNSLTAHVGMNNNESGKTAMSVTLGGMSAVEKLNFKYEIWGSLQRGDTSALGIKIDYQTAGGYTKSDYYYYGDYGYDMTLPFGKKAASDTSASFGSALSGNFEVNLTANAPSDWNGRIMISYLCQDAGKTATAKFIAN